jgi:hypothetical protein
VTALSSARRQAEEALAAFDASKGYEADVYAFDCIPPLRALLAAMPGQNETASLDTLAREVHEWAAHTFPGTDERSKSKHLLREAKELADAPTDPEEMADVFILLANLAGFVGVNLAEAVAAKHAKNKARTWGKPDADGVVEHVREAPAPCDGHGETMSRDDYVITVNRLMICAMEDIYCGRDEAGPTTLDLVGRLERHDAAMRAEVERLTRERDEARAKLAASPNPDAGHVVAMFTGLPVVLNGVLPEGSIFMHPRTFNGLPAERPSWLDRMRADAKKVTSALDGDGRDGFNGSGPFEG